MYIINPDFGTYNAGSRDARSPSRTRAMYGAFPPGYPPGYAPQQPPRPGPPGPPAAPFAPGCTTLALYKISPLIDDDLMRSVLEACGSLRRRVDGASHPSPLSPALQLEAHL